MEGRASNFEDLLADFEARLPQAQYVAIDTELTGVDLPGEPDGFEETARERLAKHCRVAERYTIIQLGLTLVTPSGTAGNFECASYNIFVFPYADDSDDSRRGEPAFMCQASSMQFNARHSLDFNAWISEGVPYVSREEERRLRRDSSLAANTDKPLEEESVVGRTGLLRLWKSLCSAKLDLIVHCPLDLFFLLAAFEQNPLPSDPEQLARLVRQCFKQVYDTAHLHGVVGRFRSVGLTKFFEDVVTRYDELAQDDASSATRVMFEFETKTAARYETRGHEMAHEAGYDSLVTAKLFAYLLAMFPGRVRSAANRLFLFKNTECIDLDCAGAGGAVGRSIFDLSTTELLVVKMNSEDDETQYAIQRFRGAEYKRISPSLLLVIVRAYRGFPATKAVQLLINEASPTAVWRPFDEWQQEARRLRQLPVCAAHRQDAIVVDRHARGGWRVLAALRIFESRHALLIILAFLLGRLSSRVLRPQWRRRPGIVS